MRSPRPRARRRRPARRSRRFRVLMAQLRLAACDTRSAANVLRARSPGRHGFLGQLGSALSFYHFHHTMIPCGPRPEEQRMRLRMLLRSTKLLSPTTVGPTTGGLTTGAGGTAATTSATTSATTGGTPGDCVLPELPDVASLPRNEKLPDPFTFFDGTPVTTKAQWDCRRREIQHMAAHYIYGPYLQSDSDDGYRGIWWWWCSQLAAGRVVQEWCGSVRVGLSRWPASRHRQPGRLGRLHAMGRQYGAAAPIAA